MPLWKRSELARHLNKHTGWVTMYVKRGKLIAEDDGRIDDSLDVNRREIEKWRRKAYENGGGEAPAPDPKPVKKDQPVTPYKPTYKPPKSVPREDSVAKKEGETRGSKLNAIALEKDRADLRLKQAKAALSEKQLEKMVGDNLPRKLVGDVFARYSKHINDENRNSAEKVVTEFSARTKMGEAARADMRQVILEEFNDNARRAADAMKRDIEKIASDFAETREKGEKKIGIRNDTQ